MKYVGNDVGSCLPCVLVSESGSFGCVSRVYHILTSIDINMLDYIVNNQCSDSVLHYAFDQTS